MLGPDSAVSTGVASAEPLSPAVAAALEAKLVRLVRRVHLAPAARRPLELQGLLARQAPRKAARQARPVARRAVQP
jgi:hypothetical protein